MKIYDNKYMYNIIFVNIKHILGSWPTCQPDHKNHMADSSTYAVCFYIM